jgi:hypothetical protein
MLSRKWMILFCAGSCLAKRTTCLGNWHSSVYTRCYPEEGIIANVTKILHYLLYDATVLDLCRLLPIVGKTEGE